MHYLIVTDGVIENIIVAGAEFAAEIGAVPDYDGAEIGQAYAPPPPLETRVKILEMTQANVWSELDAAYQEGVNTAYDS